MLLRRLLKIGECLLKIGEFEFDTLTGDLQIGAHAGQAPFQLGIKMIDNLLARFPAGDILSQGTFYPHRFAQPVGGNLPFINTLRAFPNDTAEFAELAQ